MRVFRPTLMAALVVAGSAHAAIVISREPTQNVNCSGGVCSASAAKAFLNAHDLEAMLANGDVKVASGALSGGIKVDAQVRWVQASRLTLDAYRSITFDKPLVVDGPGGLTLTYNDGAVDGDLRFFSGGHVRFGNRSGSLVISGQTYVLVGTLDEIAAQASTPFVALRRGINAAGQTYAASPVGNFTGLLEGLGNTVSNLTINPTKPGADVGLFGKLSGAVRDIGVVSVHIDGAASDQTVGALVGVCGGCGVFNSYASGQIAASDGAVLGGLVGQNRAGFIERSNAAVTVLGGTGAVYVGGLVGRMSGSCAHNCNGVVAQSYATGAVSGPDGVSAGGLIGYDLEGPVGPSYATGAVTVGNNAFAGGLIGTGEDDDIKLLLMSQTYATGQVSGGTGSKLGGFIGQDLMSHHIYDNYWDLDTSGIGNPGQGAGNISDDDGIAGLTTSQFQSGLPDGFFTSSWAEKPGVNGGYPFLLLNPPG